MYDLRYCQGLKVTTGNLRRITRNGSTRFHVAVLSLKWLCFVIPLYLFTHVSRV